MALILEVLHAGRHAEVRERHRLEGVSLTIGRGLDNAVVLDDAHVDVAHARIEAQPDGSWALVDLGSVNRIGVRRGAPVDRIAIAAGLVVTLGRTTLRFRDDLAPLPPAVPLPTAGAEPAQPAWLGTTGRRAGVVAGTIVLLAVQGWLSATMRGAASQSFALILGLAFVAALWAGVWSVAARVVLGRFNFLTHVAIAAFAVAAMVVLSEVVAFVSFMLPALEWVDGVDAIVSIAFLSAVVALHLGAASHLGTVARWRTGALASGIVLALVGVSVALEDDAFSTQAVFNAQLKMVAPAIVPKQTPAEFAETRADLRAEVDELLADR